MSELEELKEEIRLLKDHVLKIEGVLHVMLEELGKGAIRDSAEEILEVLGEGNKSW